MNTFICDTYMTFVPQKLVSPPLLSSKRLYSFYTQLPNQLNSHKKSKSLCDNEKENLCNYLCPLPKGNLWKSNPGKGLKRRKKIIWKKYVVGLTGNVSVKWKQWQFEFLLTCSSMLYPIVPTSTSL